MRSFSSANRSGHSRSNSYPIDKREEIKFSNSSILTFSRTGARRRKPKISKTRLTRSPEWKHTVGYGRWEGYLVHCLRHWRIDPNSMRAQSTTIGISPVCNAFPQWIQRTSSRDFNGLGNHCPNH